MPTPKISLIIPVLNESTTIGKQLDFLSALKYREDLEIIFADGGSEDDTVALIKSYGFRLVHSSKGRARQMNTAAQSARGDLLLFLHCDTQLPPDFAACVTAFGAKRWGFFRLRLSGKRFWFRLIASMINWRSRATAVATGDQCIFVAKDLFQQLGGYANIPLMEDVELCKRLRRLCPPLLVSAPVTTDSRRWEKHGIVNTVLLMWSLRLQYCLGVSPEKLVNKYYR
ncbi:MAG: TIGR04283 family arsenosugar biosynthesis glycosyltransferase [Pseudomonadota bacterium]